MDQDLIIGCKEWLIRNNISFKENFDLSFRSWIKAGGKIKLYINPSNTEEVKSIISFLKSKKITYYILGNISNTLIRDGDIYTPIINLQKIQNIDQISSNIYSVGAGTSISRFANYFTKRGFSGVQGLVGIPGSVGGGVFMNASSYGSCISDFLTSVIFMDEYGKIYKKKKDQLFFSWRSSYFHKKNLIILKVEFEFTKKESQLKLDNYINEIKAHRGFYQENTFPNLGSLFATKNIYKDLSKNSISLYCTFLIHNFLTILFKRYSRANLIRYRKFSKSLYLNLLKIKKINGFGFSEKTLNCVINLGSKDANKAIELINSFQENIRYSIRREIIILDKIK